MVTSSDFRRMASIAPCVENTKKYLIFQLKCYKSFCWILSTLIFTIYIEFDGDVLVLELERERERTPEEKLK